MLSILNYCACVIIRYYRIFFRHAYTHAIKYNLKNLICPHSNMYRSEIHKFRAPFASDLGTQLPSPEELLHGAWCGNGVPIQVSYAGAAGCMSHEGGIFASCCIMLRCIQQHPQKKRIGVKMCLNDLNWTSSHISQIHTSDSSTDHAAGELMASASNPEQPEKPEVMFFGVQVGCVDHPSSGVHPMYLFPFGSIWQYLVILVATVFPKIQLGYTPVMVISHQPGCTSNRTVSPSWSAGLSHRKCPKTPWGFTEKTVTHIMTSKSNPNSSLIERNWSKEMRMKN